MGKKKKKHQVSKQGEGNDVVSKSPRQSDKSSGKRDEGSSQGGVIELSDSTDDGQAMKTEVNGDKPSTSAEVPYYGKNIADIYKSKSQKKSQQQGATQDGDRKAAASNQVRDKRLIVRIREYLGTLTNTNFVSIPRMAEYLQKKYPEYGRRPKNMFTRYVDKAYFFMDKGTAESASELQESDSEKKAMSDSDSDVDVEVVETLVDYKNTNAINNMMSNMYRNSPTSVSDDRKRKQELALSPNIGNSKRSKSDSETKEKVLYASPDVLQRNLNSTGLTGPRRSAADRYFIDRKGDNQPNGIEETNSDTSREANIQRFLGGLPSRTSYSAYVNSKNDPRQTSSNLLYKIYRDPKQPLSKREQDKAQGDGGVTEDNVGVSTQPPRSPTPHPEYRIEGQGSSEDISDGGGRMGRDGDKTLKQKSTKKHKKSSSKSKKQDKRDKDQPKQEKGPAVQTSSVTFADIGGNESTLIEICKLLVHMRHPEVYTGIGITPPRGFLLHGPPGCGKTLLANAVAGELDLPLIKIAATEIVSGVSGDSEEKIRDLFDKAIGCAPCIMFIDEIDSITPKRETASKDMERRIVAQLLACMDDLNSKATAHVLVIGATNRPDSLDPALRRAGRFDREICLGIPDEHARLGILKVLSKELRLTPDFDHNYLAKATPGYVGADLMALTREAAMVAVNRVFQDLQSQRTAKGSESCHSACLEIDMAPSVCINNSNKSNESSDKHTTNAAVDSPQENSLTQSLNAEIKSEPVVDPAVNMNETVQEPAEMKCEVLDGANINVCGDTGQDVVEVKTEVVDNTSNTNSDPLVNGDERTAESNIGETVLVKSSITQDLNNHRQQPSTAATDSTNSVVASDVHSDCNPGATAMEVDQSVSANQSDADKNHETEKENLQVDKDSTQPQDCVNRNTNAKLKDELSSVLSWLKEQPPLTEEQLRDLYITIEDFKEALKHVQPSAKREGFATIPDVTWDDIGALHEVREELQLAILAPVRHAEEFQRLGLSRAQGILLAGPPGCGKTLLAKAVANESGINFISVKGPELLNMYVGESERAVRTVFQRARNSAPCVIFFDELDALCPRRSGSSESGSSARVVNQLLTEMDGLEERKQVFIMAATNRPDIIDPAVLRPGRLDKTLYVGLPSAADRLDIFKCITKNGTRPSLADDVNLAKIAEDKRCVGYTGADLAALIRESSLAALKEVIKHKSSSSSSVRVNMEHFNTAFKKIKPSVSAKDQQKYTQMGNKLSTE